MNDLLRTLVDLRDRQIQKARIQFSNRLSALERGADTDDTGEQGVILQRYFDRFDALEAEIDADIADLVSVEPIYPLVTAVKGIGPMSAAKLIAMIDIERSPTVSALWRYAGFAVINGEREKPVKGEKLHYNKRLKTECYKMATSFLRANSPYRIIYDEARAQYDTRADWTPLHQHHAALRKMVKVFLQHLWIVWRQMEGLPVSMPYAHAQMGHGTYYPPEQFGWPVATEMAA